MAEIWSQDETIGWVYQYFTPKELRDQARKESAAPRNSYELAFRNQFFTPRYVVEFLTDNTLGRIWYEMRKGETTQGPVSLLGPPAQRDLPGRRTRAARGSEGSQGRPVPRGTAQAAGLHPAPAQERPSGAQDPRPGLRQRSLPALLLRPAPDHLRGSLRRSRPGASAQGGLSHAGRPATGCASADPRLNLHGIDIDLRATQIAALALWLRCQRAYQDMG